MSEDFAPTAASTVLDRRLGVLRRIAVGDEPPGSGAPVRSAGAAAAARLAQRRRGTDAPLQTLRGKPYDPSDGEIRKIHYFSMAC